MKLLLSAVALCAISFSAQAADNMFIAAGNLGGEHSDYATLGVAAPLPGSTLGNGWVARLFAEELTYRYTSGARHIDANAQGVAATLGYQYSFSGGWWGAYAGPSYRDTHLSPNDPASNTRGGDTSLRLQAEGERIIASRFKLGINGSYDAFGAHSYWTRLRALYQLHGPIYAGPEISAQGDDDYKAQQYGLTLVGIALTDHSSLGFDAGLRKSDHLNSSPYAGLEFGLVF